MAVTFGTPVVVNYDGPRTSCTWAMTVTSGDPIILSIENNDASYTAPIITDTFATPYTWTLICASGLGNNYWYALQYIGTGGAGTTGTIKAVVPSSYPGGTAVEGIGASLATGLLAIDTSTAASSGGGDVIAWPTLSPSVPDGGAIFSGVCTQSYWATLPSSPWVNTLVDNIPYAGAPTGAVSLQPSLAGSPISGVVWVCSGGDAPPYAGCVILPGGAPPPPPPPAGGGLLLAPQSGPQYPTIMVTSGPPIGWGPQYRSGSGRAHR